MKYIVTILLVLAFSGCSNTWQGVKQDSKNAGQWTKEKVHNGAEWVSEKTE
ncbi:hypothetical protein OFO01_02535 [Campylobacter sp. JMF_01 NE2]|uniref:hypothetical protein n=1 Tax=unclassified Campylobacter TaxID=2593542 RepID=UPI0022E9C95D|nr:MULTISPECIES: hypothetical protein [unclassified Campylobacter]MDA3043203.1 hypothetical protein [Campylobacter sp. JMF_09 ED2]MDA3045108.1 hypothetical protein [Campylobacter sp. JMF_07 ED4]MDA3045688.1 hypothetical protein [Campylobacter sp. VBCF_06 NA8]MDA3047969.1 hypothetical protein [Campylobacter sp. JMF_08 NE1]MDA3049915.1 hypothetical protein [Campylobacter sp. JMF_15 NE4]